MWTLDRLNSLITDKVEENKHLEYKGPDSLGSSDAKKKEISKDISSFANSDGGIIIYGIKEFDDKDKSNLPEKIVPVNRLEYSKEWLENVITGNISPAIHAVEITSVVAEEDNNKVVYVVEIKKSNTAHQANDYRYYRRYNFKAVPMEDWEVKDVMNRANKPIIKMMVGGHINDDDLLGDNFSKYEIQVILKNEGNVAVQHIECFLEFEKELLRYFKSPDPLTSGPKMQVPFNNRKEHSLKIGGQETVLSVSTIPLLPEVFREIGVIKLRKNIFNLDGIFKCIVTTEYGMVIKEYSFKEILVTK